MRAGIPRRVIMLEFNELCPPLLSRFMEEGQLPNFSKLFETSLVCTTDAQEEPKNLEPWIQWVTVHSGQPFSEHQVFLLGDGRKAKHKLIGDVLSSAGVEVGIMGSMNTNYSSVNGYVVPDAWDPEGQSYPNSLGLFYRVVSKLVQESSRERLGGKGDLLNFGLFMLKNGLSHTSITRILSQLLKEVRDPAIKWRRAVLLDLLQYDLFRELNRRFDVKFATLFSNSTAHFQHYYWRNMDPNRFGMGPSEQEHPSLKTAILYGYQSMDNVIGRVLMDYPKDIIMLCSALSQQPYETTKVSYRPHDFQVFLEFAGVPSGKVVVKPVMAQQFHLICSDSTIADLVEARLGDLFVEHSALMTVNRDGNGVFTGCRIYHDGSEDKIVVQASTGRSKRLGDLFYKVHSMRSGRHHPDGVLWIRTDGMHRILDEKVSLTSIAPTILNFFRVPQPNTMHGQPLSFFEREACLV
jgi:hypothetical protein